MPRPNAPWFRTSTQSWYVTIDGKKVPLGVRGRENRKAAMVAFGWLLAERSPNPFHPAPPPPATAPAAMPSQPPASPGLVPPAGNAATVASLLERFLASAHQRLKPATVARYRYDVGEFAKRFGSTPPDRLTPEDLTAWVASIRGCDTTRVVMLRSVSAFLGWAVKARVIAENPARGIPRPKPRARAGESVLTEGDVAKLLDAAATPGFRLVLRVLHATGCRPGEVAKVTAENFDAANRVAVLADHKTDRTGKPRLIFFPPDVAAELAALAARYGSGPLLRSNKGKPWRARSVMQAMRRTARRAGVKAIAYHFRHTFATDALANGVPEAQVAALIGHAGTAVLHKHYSHLGAKAATLRDALGRVRG